METYGEFYLSVVKLNEQTYRVTYLALLTFLSIVGTKPVLPLVYFGLHSAKHRMRPCQSVVLSLTCPASCSLPA